MVLDAHDKNDVVCLINSKHFDIFLLYRLKGNSEGLNALLCCFENFVLSSPQYCTSLSQFGPSSNVCISKKFNLLPKHYKKIQCFGAKAFYQPFLKTSNLIVFLGSEWNFCCKLMLSSAAYTGLILKFVINVLLSALHHSKAYL